MTNFVSTAVNAAKVPLKSVAAPLIVGAVIIALGCAIFKINW